MFTFANILTKQLFRLNFMEMYLHCTVNIDCVPSGPLILEFNNNLIAFNIEMILQYQLI